jgi:periplasmic divalent cation tolerance protein
MAEEAIDRTGAVAVILTTLPDAAAGDSLVRRLVDERLIACGNLLPGLVSVYRWNDEIARESEVLVVMKTATSVVDRLFDRIADLHPYEVPELVELPVEAVAGAYSRWVIENSKVSA